MDRFQLYIDGAFDDGAARFPSIDPATGAPWADMPEAREAEVDRAVCPFHAEAVHVHAPMERVGSAAQVEDHRSTRFISTAFRFGLVMWVTEPSTTRIGRFGSAENPMVTFSPEHLVSTSRMWDRVKPDA